MRHDLTDLRLFIHIAECGSITQGAARANLALASASERVRGMEAAFGVPLLTRQRRGVALTAAGHVLLQHALGVINRIEAMAGEMAAHARGLRMSVRLVTNTAAAHELLGGRLACFLVSNPHIDIDLDERPSHVIAELVAGGRADLGIAATWAGIGHLQQRPFMTDRLAVITPTADGAADGRFAAVLRQRLVGLPVGNSLQEHIERQAARLGLRLECRARAGTLSDVCTLVAAGVGPAIVPLTAARRHRPQGSLRYTLLNEPWATRDLSLCARDFAALTPQARLLADALSKHARRDPAARIGAESN